jgi:hypothetical protein
LRVQRPINCNHSWLPPRILFAKLMGYANLAVGPDA